MSPLPAHTLNPVEPVLDLAPWVGQRTASFRFELFDGVNGLRKGLLHPLADQPTSLAHDTTRTIKRSLTLNLGIADTTRVDIIRDRIDLFMIIKGVDYPLGRYMFTDSVDAQWTSGQLGSYTLTDEMFIVDQALEHSFSPVANMSVEAAITELLDELPQIRYLIEPSALIAAGSWAAGTSRAQAINDLCVQGGYFTPWFDNAGMMRIIQAFDPADRVNDLNLDIGNQVVRGTVANSDDLLTAPNRFIVISNGSTGDAAALPAVGVYDVPSSAPHSIQNRGFVIPDVRDMQLSTQNAAQTAARTIGLTETVFETVNLSTAPDPRHDGYDVVHWNGEHWLELAWTLTLREGAPMAHVMRKAYFS